MTATSDSELAWIERTGVLETDAPPWDALSDLGLVRSPTLCPLVRSSAVPDGVALVHRVPVGAVTLAELRAGAPLRAGHVVTVAVAVVDALAALHDVGLAHGGITPEQVLVAPDGSVHLSGCGLAWRRAPGDPHGPRPSDDVAHVGELVRDALGAGTGHSGLVLVALRAGDADALLRPDASELRAALLRCARPDPLLELLWRTQPSRRPEPGVVRAGSRAVLPRLGGDPGVPVGHDTAARRFDHEAHPPVDVSAPPSRPAGPGSGVHRGRGRPGRAAVTAAALVLLAALLLAALRVQDGALAAVGPPTVGSGDPSTSASTRASEPEAVASESSAAEATVPAAGEAGSSSDVTAPDPVGSTSGGTPPLVLDRGDLAPDWPTVLDQVDEGRRTAIAAGSSAQLAGWVDPDGAAWTDDAALARRVRALGAVVDGGRLEVLEVRPDQVGAVDAVLLVRDRRAAYTVALPGSATPVSVPERKPRWWRVTLRLAGERWRVRAVSAVPPPTTSSPAAG